MRQLKWAVIGAFLYVLQEVLEVIVGIFLIALVLVTEFRIRKGFL